MVILSMKFLYSRMSDEEIKKIIGQNQVLDIKDNSFMIDYMSDWNGGYIPNKGSKTSNNQLPIGNQPLLSKTQVAEAYKISEQSENKIINNTHKKLCCCDIKDLCTYGCKCGGI